MKRYVLGLSFLLIGACSVDTTGLLESDFRWSASPSTICPGDASTLDWEVLSVPRSREYCDEPYQTSSVCTITGDCEAGETCIDQQCRRPGDDVQEIDFGDGCPIDGMIRITQLDTTTNEVGDVDSSDRVQGSKEVSPSNTTVYTALYDVDGERVATTTATVTVIGVEEVTANLDFGTFTCRDAGGTLSLTLGSSTTGLDPSSSVFLARVTNTSRATIVVTPSSPSFPLVRLVPGDSTDDFNGVVPREWSVRLDITELPSPTSCALDTDGFEPIEVTLELTLACG